MLAAGLAPGTSGAARLAQEIQEKAFSQTQTDHRVRAVYAAWAACMRQRGHDYPNPFKAAADAKWNMGAPPTAAEIRTAQADVACKQRTNLLGITFAVEAGYENAAIAQNPAALAALRSVLTAQARSLARMLGRRAG